MLRMVTRRELERTIDTLRTGTAAIERGTTAEVLPTPHAVAASNVVLFPMYLLATGSRGTNPTTRPRPRFAQIGPYPLPCCGEQVTLWHDTFAGKHQASITCPACGAESDTHPVSVDT